MSGATARRAPRSDGARVLESLSKSEIFDLLRNKRRRFVLHYMKRHHDEPVELGDLATVVAAWENDVSTRAVTSEQRKRVYTTLQQSHLPKMADAGIVSYESDRGVIRARDVVDDLTIYLEIVPSREFAWHEYYLGLGAVCTSLMVAVWAGVYPIAFAPPIIWGTVISVALVVSAAVHVYTQRGMGIGAGEVPHELGLEE